MTIFCPTPTLSRPMKPLPLLLATVFTAALVSSPLRASDVGKRFPSEKTVYSDKTTGVPMTFLTTGPANDSKIYQDHPQWTADGQYIIFRSDSRAANGGTQAFAVNEKTGEIIQLTDGPGNNTGTLNSNGGTLTGLLLPEMRLISVPSRANYWSDLQREYDWISED